MIRESFGDDTATLGLIPETPKYPQQLWGCFASPESLLRWLDARAKSDYWHREAFETKDIAFCGTPTWEAMESLCRDGWPEGAARVARIRDKINATRPKAQRLARWSVAGAYPSVGRYLAGNPDCMRATEHTTARKRPIMTLLAHIGGLANVDAATFINKAGVTCALVDAIEEAGYSCHVVAWQQSHDPDKIFLQGSCVTLKSPGEAMDISRMAFALGHPSYFRRAIFALKGSDKRCKRLTKNMGYTCDFTSEREPNVFSLPSMNVNARDFETESLAVTKGLQGLVATLKSQGCPAFGD